MAESKRKGTVARKVNKKATCPHHPEDYYCWYVGGELVICCKACHKVLRGGA